MTGNERAKPIVAIAILNFNDYRVTAQCLDSLAGLDYPNFEIVLVDNGSEDGSQAFFREEYPHITLLENEINLGFTGGNNTAIEYVLERDFDYLLLLNSDTEVEPSFLDRMVGRAEEREEVGMLNPKILYYDFPKLLWYGGGRISFFRGVEHFRFMKESTPETDREREVSFITGCAFLVKMEVLQKIGRMDDRLFLYCEDLDWSFKVQEAGYRGLYVPEAVIWHKQKIGGEEDERDAFRKGLGARNLLFVFSRHFPRFKFSLFLLYYLFLWGPFKSLRYMLRGKFKTTVALWKGVFEFFNMGKAR